jgi:hypothetical protein
MISVEVVLAHSVTMSACKWQYSGQTNAFMRFAWLESTMISTTESFLDNPPISRDAFDAG